MHADLAEDDGFRARFRREVAASRRVSGAYTAPVLDADADAPAPWPASAFVPGPSLSQALETVRALPVPSVRQLTAGLAQALADIHRAGLIHLDLKRPSSSSSGTLRGGRQEDRRGHDRRHARIAVAATGRQALCPGGDGSANVARPNRCRPWDPWLPRSA